MKANMLRMALGKHRSHPYNPDIANSFFRAGEIESWGRGIERVMAICKENGCPKPELRYEGGGVWVTFTFLEQRKEEAIPKQESKDILARIAQALPKHCPSIAQALPKHCPSNWILLLESW